MLFKKERWFKDEELGLLYARTSILEPSIIKWKKRIDFLGFDLNIEVSGSSDNLNHVQRKIIVNALNEREFLEEQVLEAIENLCTKYNLNFETWEDFFQCSRIHVEKGELYISIEDIVNYLTYELELKWY